MGLPPDGDTTGGVPRSAHGAAAGTRRCRCARRAGCRAPARHSCSTRNSALVACPPGCAVASATTRWPPARGSLTRRQRLGGRGRDDRRRNRPRRAWRAGGRRRLRLDPRTTPAERRPVNHRRSAEPGGRATTGGGRARRARLSWPSSEWPGGASTTTPRRRAVRSSAWFVDWQVQHRGMGWPASNAGTSTEVVPRPPAGAVAGTPRESRRAVRSSQRAVVPSMPRRTSPLMSPSSEVVSATMSASDRWMRRACSTTRCPSTVIWPVARSTSVTPVRARRRCATNVGLHRVQRLAAPENVPWSAIATSAASWRRSMTASLQRRRQVSRIEMTKITMFYLQDHVIVRTITYT